MAIAQSSAFQVCEESPAAVRDEVIALHNATRRQPHGVERFEWMYLRNPDGPAVVWSVRDAQTGEMAGFTASVPRRMWVDGGVRTCWIGADFSMQPKYRTLGPAMKLRRAVKEAVDAGRAEFLYSHPNARMAAVHARVGHTTVGRMVRYAKVMRIEPYLRDRLGERLRSMPGLALVGALANPLLRACGREFWHRIGCEVRWADRLQFDESFDRLFAETAPRWRVLGVRDARYLTWRYADNPLYETQMLTAHAGGRLRGYVLLTVEDDCGYIKDLFPGDNGEIARDLLAAAIRHTYRLKLRNLSLTTLENNPLLPLARQFGFRPRPDGSEMVAYAPPDGSCCEAVLNPDSWYVTVGDRDV